VSASLAIDRILCVAAALGLAWMLVPLFVASIGWRPVQVTVDDDPAGVEPGSGDPSYRLRFNQLVAAGFRPLGTTMETSWFNTPLRWHRRSLQAERWLGAPDRRTFVELHRIIVDEPVRFGAITLLEGGGMVRTTCPGAGLSGDVGPRYRRTEVQNVDAAELLGRHRKNVEAFCRERDLLVREATLHEVAAEEAACSRLTLKKLPVRGYWLLMLVILAVPLSGLLLMLHTPGREERHLHDLAVSALAATAMFAVVRHHLLNVALRQRALKSHGLG
jgi:hypothetical protein